MGLDMMAYTRATAPDKEVDFLDPDDPASADGDIELHYWRKHPNLHGWMERLYYSKGGCDETFNCVPVVLTAADISLLEKDIRENALPHTTGFFFGASDGSEKEDDLEFITKAREAIANGLTVYYSSWW